MGPDGLQKVRELLDGAEFGVDLIDNNPPLIYWLSMAPVALARWTGAPAFVFYYLTVFAALVLCVAQNAKQLALDHPRHNLDKERP